MDTGIQVMASLNGFDHDPIVQFQKWYGVAGGTIPRHASLISIVMTVLRKLIRRIIIRIYPPFDLHQPDSFVLATTGKDGHPSARLLLFKGLDGDCFVFYTNYSSRKAMELDAVPYASMIFHWGQPERQVRLEGKVEKLQSDISDKYWLSRPRESRFSALASKQSTVLSDPSVLKKRINELRAEYDGKEIPRPDFWGGYRLIPDKIEFWEGKLHRRHERVLYSLKNGKWEREWLFP